MLKPPMQEIGIKSPKILGFTVRNPLQHIQVIILQAFACPFKTGSSPIPVAPLSLVK